MQGFKDFRDMGQGFWGRGFAFKVFMLEGSGSQI